MNHSTQSVVRPIVLAAAAAVGAFVLHTSGSAQGRRSMTIDDVVTAVRVTDPALSPDSRWIAYVRTTTDLASGRRNGDIYILPAAGSAAPKLLAGGEQADGTPQFSPDSKSVAFISSRGAAPQVFVVPVSGGSPRPLTKLSAGVQPPLVFSPDGRRVAFVSDVFKDCQDEECNKRRGEALEKDPVKVRHITELMFRHWDEWRETRRHHIFVTEIESGDTRDVTPGDFDAPPHNYEDDAIAFSADSRQIAFVSKREGRDREAWSTNMDVWVTPVTGGEIKKITPNPAADDSPLFSRDGRSLIVRAQRRAGFESDRRYLDVYDLQNGARRTVFDTPDLSVDEFRLSLDGVSIWFTATEQGRENLYVVPFAGGVPKRVATGGAIGSIEPGDGFVMFAKSTMTAPAEVFRISNDGSGLQSLTRENVSWLNAVSTVEPESLTVRGGDGTPVQYWLLKPPNFNPSQKYPAVFLIHGGPQGSWEDGWSSRWNPALWASQGWVVAAPNPRGSTGFGQKFVDEISQDWGGRVMADVDAVFNAVAAQPFIDANRLGIAGASYGGYAVNWILGHTHRFKAAVSHDGIFNLESMAYATEELWFPEWEFGGPPWSAKARENFAKWSPHLFADKITTPTLVITNEQDFRVPVDQGLQLLTALRRNGVPAEGLVFPDEGHWVLKPLNSKRWHDAVFDWMRKHL
jgi:dipeptidyl aminopeptidase/acylaminoacyl peptidase